MRTALRILGLAMAPALAPVPGLADAGHGSGQMAVGMPAMHGHEPTRTIDVIMREDYDKDAPFVFEPSADMVFAAGETVRLHIVNMGEETHEFVMDTMAENAEHKVLMAKFPEMEHEEPYMVHVEAGEKGESGNEPLGQSAFPENGNDEWGGGQGRIHRNKCGGQNPIHVGQGVVRVEKTRDEIFPNRERMSFEVPPDEEDASQAGEPVGEILAVVHERTGHGTGGTTSTG